MPLAAILALTSACPSGPDAGGQGGDGTPASSSSSDKGSKAKSAKATGTTTDDVFSEDLEPQGVKLSKLPEPPAVIITQKAVSSGKELDIVAARPRGSVTMARTAAITFSRPVAALQGASATAPQDMAVIEPAIEGEWRWLGSTTLEFTPKAGRFPKASSFKVKVREGIKAIDGTVMEQPFEFSFSTQVPEVNWMEPSCGSDFIRTDAQIALIVNQAVKDIEQHVKAFAGGKEIPLKLTRSILSEQYRREEAKKNGEWYSREPIAPDGDMRYEFKPTKELPKGTKIEVKVDDTLEGAAGPATVSSSYDCSFNTYGAHHLGKAFACGPDWGSCPYGPLYLTMANPADLDSLKEKLTVEPEIELDWDNASSGTPYSWQDTKESWARVPGRFRPGETYKVKIAGGLKDMFGQTTDETFEGEIKTDDREPSLSVGNSEVLLESGGDRKIPLLTVNAEKTKAKLWKLTPQEFIQQLTHNRWSDKARPSIAAEPVEMDVDLSGKKNQTHYAPLSLAPVIPEDAKSAFILAEVSELVKTKYSRPDYIIAQVTDLAIHAHMGSQDGIVWVTSITDGASVSDADVTIYDGDGKEIWKGKTNAEGLVAIPGVVKLLPKEEQKGSMDWDNPTMLFVAEKDGDMGATWSKWNDGIAPGMFDSVWTNWQGTKPSGVGELFTERGIYRPGDPLYVKGVSRYFKNGVLYAPVENARVHVEIEDPNDKVFFKKDLKLSAYGTFDLTTTLPKDRPLGRYYIRATIKQGGKNVSMNLTTSFRVEEYRAPQFQVDVVAPSDHAIAGNPLKATVQARYLFGGAMNDAVVQWTAQRSQTSFEPPKNQGFTFGNHVWGWDDGEPVDASSQAAKGEGRVDATGAFYIDGGKLETPGNLTWSYDIEADVTDVNRQHIANRTSITVHPADASVGVRLVKDGFASVGKEVKAEFVAAAPDGSRMEGLEITSKVMRREWKSIRKKGVGGQWFTTSEPVEEEVKVCDAVKSAAEPVACTFKPEKPGLHLIEAVVKDSAGRTHKTRQSFYVVGKGFVAWQQNDDKTLELVSDKDKYDVGETAKILIKSPWPKAEALVTVERVGIMMQRRISIQDSAVSVSIPLKEYHIPNAFVSVTMVRGRAKDEAGAPVFKAGADDAGRPDIRVGYLRINVENKSKRLKVSVKSDKEEYKPRDTVNLSVQVDDHQGHGRQSEVLVWAVDEGVLRLTNYSIPDLVNVVHSARGLSVKNADSMLKLLIAQLYGEKGETVGGSGGKDGSGSGLRSRFVTSPLFKTVETDANGLANVSFELPDNLTTYRLMALAVTKKDLFGSGDSKLVVSKPLLAMPSLARFALSGDTVEAGVVLHRRGTGTAQVTVKATAQGVELLEDAVKTVTIESGKPREVRFRYRAVRPGEASLRFDIESGGDSDAVLQKFPVSLPVQREAVATSGSTADEITEGIQVPEGVLTDRGGLELTFSSTLLGGFDAGMRQLIEYPYGCAEQLSSRLIPFVVLRTLYGKYGVPYQAPEGEPNPMAVWLGQDSLLKHGSKDPDEVVKATITAIEALQMSNGGFRYWPDSKWPSADGSVYATLALGRAAEVGYSVKKEVLDKAKKFLAAEIASGTFRYCPWSFCGTVSKETRVFALYALARLGAPQASYYPTFFKDRAKLAMDSRAMLADAIAVTGHDDAAMAQTIFDELTAMAQETPTEIHFSTTSSEGISEGWSSPVRTNALILQTMADLKPEHPWLAKLTKYLMTARRPNGEYRNTQEAAFALMALGEVSRATEKEAPDFTARAIMGESNEVASHEFKGHSMKVEHKNVAMADLVKDANGAAQSLKLKRDGQAGTLRYTARLTYYPRKMATEPLERGITVQRWFEPWQGGGQARGFKAGELIRLKARVASPMDRVYVVVNIPLPAGLEAVDTSLASTAKLPGSDAKSGNSGEGEFDGECEGEDCGGSDDVDEDMGFYSPFGHTELRDDRILTFADELPAGVHTLEFPVRATTPGTFQLMPAQAELMYAPEVFGRSDGGTFTVVIEDKAMAK